jgi:hypothetical protein
MLKINLNDNNALLLLVFYIFWFIVIKSDIFKYVDISDINYE